VARALVGFQQLDRIGEDPTLATGEAKDALQRPERVGCALRRATVGRSSVISVDTFSTPSAAIRREARRGSRL
jgi:hypothetical protein